MFEEIQILVENLKQLKNENDILQKERSARTISIHSNHNRNYSNDLEKDKKIMELENKVALLASENQRLSYLKVNISNISKSK